MKNPVKDPLDKLFESLNDAAHESPSAAFVKDLEARLDALEKKRRKPFFAWWVFSALGAVVLVSTYYFFVPNSTKSKNPNKPTSLARLIPSTASNSNSSTISALTITSATLNTSSPTLVTSNTSSVRATTKSSSLAPSSTSASVSSFPLSIAAPSIKVVDVQQETYVINPILLSGLHTNDSVLTVNQPLPVLQNELTPSKKRVQHQFGLQFGVSAIFSSFDVPTTASSLTSNELKLYREARELGERKTSSWDFNLRYDLSLGRCQIQTGLHYFEWGEQFQYPVISVEGINRYRYVNLPVLLGYSFDFGKVQLLPFAGIAVGKSFSSQGNYIVPEVNGVEIANAKNIAGAFIGQLELQYALTPQLRFTCTPVYRRTMGALIEEGLLINRYQSFGLLTGFIFTIE